MKHWIHERQALVKISYLALMQQTAPKLPKLFLILWTEWNM
jgi:hypothetical protein